MPVRHVGALSAGLCAVVTAATFAIPAAAQEMRMAQPGRAPAAGDRAHPMASDLGMPLDSGEVNLRALAGIAPGGFASSVFGINAGLTDAITLELRAPYIMLGGGAGYFSGLTAAGQIGIWEAPARNMGLSASLGLELPGGPAGFTVAGLTPILGLRSMANMGPLQTHLNFFARPLAGTLSWQLASMLRATEMISPGLELMGTSGAATSLSLVPEIKFRPIRNLAVGIGYQVPLAAASAGQLLAELELLF